MTAPGDFSSGDVLTAADMNALPGGELMYVETESDISIGASFTDIIDGSFTVASSRRVLLTGFTPQWTSLSTSGISVLYLNSASASSPGTYYNASYLSGASGQQQFVIVQRVLTFTAGTYPVYLFGVRTAGTATLDNGNGVRRTFISAHDLGAA